MLFNVTSRVFNDSILYVSDSDALGITARSATDRVTELSRVPARTPAGADWSALGDNHQSDGHRFICIGQQATAL